MSKKKSAKSSKKVAAKKSPAAKAKLTVVDSLGYKLTPEQIKAQKLAVEHAKKITALQTSLRAKSLQELLDWAVSNPYDFYYALAELATRTSNPIMVELAGRRYTAKVSNYYAREGMFGGAFCQFVLQTNLYDVSWNHRFEVDSSDFSDQLKNPVSRSFSEQLKVLGLIVASDEQVKEEQDLIKEVHSLNKKPGAIIDIAGSILQKSFGFFGPPIIDRPFGTEKYPRAAIIEPSLELASQDTYYDDEQVADTGSPFLRVFSLDLKQYVFVDVRDVKEHKFQESMLDKLVLPAEMKAVLTSVFDSKDVFGDLFNGRHGGMIMLANGSAGTGKTLSAEVFAEKTKRPLYVLEMGELGVNLDRVEQSLQVIFARAARWNAVLLFDEVDIFLSKRTEHDLERNAIVGVFLRLLDQYRGMLFLTTNRADVIDPAFASRITLRLDYPELNAESRKEVWQNMFKAAGLSLFGGIVDGNFDEIAKEKLNGRQIRNVVRLLKAVSPTDVVDVDAVKKYMKFSPRTEDNKN